MKGLKKILTIILAACLIVATVATTGFAETDSRMSVQNNFNDLASCFTVKKASTTDMKYAYYSPVKSENDMTKYPLVVYVHGLFHGWTDKSFVNSGLTYWASDEVQSLFNENGAHLIMPKIPETTITATQVTNVYKVITEYISENVNNVDTNQILIMGGSAGGGLAWNLMIAYPELFSAGVVLCATKSPSANEVKKCANLPIWEISAKTDPLINYTINQKPTWNKICKYSNVADQCRWTVFSNRVYLPDGSNPGISHFLAKTIGYNLCLISNNNVLPGCTTIDGNGNNIEISIDNSIIQWFQSFNA